MTAIELEHIDIAFPRPGLPLLEIVADYSLTVAHRRSGSRPC